MSASEVRAKLEELFRIYPNQLLMIRSPEDVDRINMVNADHQGFF
jgi:hypothetical protein